MRSHRSRGARTLSVLAAPIVGTPLVAAQIRHPGQPVAARVELPPPTLEIPAPDVRALLAEDEAHAAFGIGPVRYGVLVPAPFALQDIATWEVTADGEVLVGRVRLHAPGAHSLGLELSAFELPEGGQLHLYDDSLAPGLGPTPAPIATSPPGISSSNPSPATRSSSRSPSPPG